MCWTTKQISWGMRPFNPIGRAALRGYTRIISNVVVKQGVAAEDEKPKIPPTSSHPGQVDRLLADGK
jgi:hypothetical protein